jgi:protein-disulfide isomerase
VETGKVKYVMKEFPITSIHPQAQKASEAALCAMDQGKYWEMHDILFANQRQMQMENLLAFGVDLALEEAIYKDCLESGKYEEWVKADFAEGSKLGIRGTPTFLLGTTSSEDPTRFTATKVLRGALPFASFKEAIDGLLNPESAADSEKPS